MVWTQLKRTFFRVWAGQEPQWLELFGQFLRPNSILDVMDSSIVNDETRDVFGCSD
jgi:hypothetical protein